MWTVCRGLRRLVAVQPIFDVSLLSTRTWRFFWPRDNKPAKSKDQQQQQQKTIQQQQPAKQNLYDKESMRQLVRQQKVVIFMKGQPDRPLCGYSNAVCQILQMHGVEFTAHDVLHNDKLKTSLKEFSEWPTIPQVFIDGEFIGGFDILLLMHKNGDLVKELQKAGITSKMPQAQPTEEKSNAVKPTETNAATAAKTIEANSSSNSNNNSSSSTPKVADAKPKQATDATPVQQVLAAISSAVNPTAAKPPLQQQAATAAKPSTAKVTGSQPPQQTTSKGIPEKQAATDPKSVPTAKH